MFALELINKTKRIMCGILATFGKADATYVSQQSALMAHRGPDERGMVETSLGILCHERLSIVDTATGRQPINGTRNCYVVHNGEIFNHVQLHAETLKGKYKCHTTSDSEVIIHMYEEFGIDFCNMLDGFYAFAIIDEDKKKFMVARDPIGIKPLYYGTDKNGTMWFASEMKSLCDACVDINVFPPGYYYTPETGFVKFYIPKWETTTADDYDATDLRDYLERSVDKRLMCDVPFGVLLSGGLDSSLIAAITARKLKEQGKQLHSFSIGLTADAPDLIAARQVAEFIGTIHHEVHFTVEEGIAAAEKLIYNLESYDITTLRASTPMFLLGKYIRDKGFKMVLSGEGADEVFGGYLYFYNAPTLEEFQEETKRRVRLLHTADVLRADKSMMASSIEVREPMLDKYLLDKAIGLHPSLKMPIKPGVIEKGRIEKYVLRAAFDNAENPYLPHHILWRQKEQFSDGVGYNWIDGFKAYCEAQVSDEQFSKAAAMYPHHTPETKEAFFIREKFASYFPHPQAETTVSKWMPKWQKSSDPSGRANELHEAATQVLS